MQPKNPATSRRTSHARSPLALSLSISIPALTTLLLYTSVTFFVTIPFVKDHLMRSKYHIVESQVSAALSLIKEYYRQEQSGLLSREEAQKKARETLRYMRYGDDEYFFICDYNYLSVMHPLRQNLEGTSMEQITDPKGNYFIRTLVNIAQNNTKGFVSYEWYKKGSNDQIRIPKVAFIHSFEPWRWAIGSGVSIGDALAEIQRSTQNTILLNLIIVLCALTLSLVIIIQSIKVSKRQHAAQTALRAEKERLSVTLRSIGDGVITTDTNGAVVIMNTVAETLTGWALEQAQGKPLAEIFPIINELTGTPCENPVDKVLQTGQIIELANHTVLKSRDGTWRVIADSGAPIRDADGTILGVVLVFRDMTEKQKLIEASQKNQKLESLGLLAGGIAHDFNNFLTGILGCVELALDESKGKGRIATYLESAQQSIERAKNLTMQLLTFSKGGAPIKKTALLTPIIEQILPFTLSGSNCTYHLFSAPDLWPCNIDSDQVGQVVENIIINAKQAMSEGGTITVTITNLVLLDKEHPTLPAGSYVQLTMEDTGPGIPPGIIKRIFDPFFTTKPKGNGLGLATSYSIISRHGGVIDAESTVGKGATFTIVLPAIMDTVEEQDDADAVSHKGQGTILIMDDDEVICLILDVQLRSMGYSVVISRDGEHALKLFEEYNSKENLVGVFLDLTIRGGVGGKETAMHIRSLDKKIPLFIISGYDTDDPVIADPSRYGFTASIRKPFNRTAIATLLKQHLPHLA